MTSSHFIHKFWENPPFLTRHQLKFSRCLLHFQNVLQINFKNAVFLLESFFMKNFEYQFTVDNENMQMRIFVLKILRHNLKFPHTHTKKLLHGLHQLFIKGTRNSNSINQRLWRGILSIWLIDAYAGDE